MDTLTKIINLNHTGLGLPVKWYLFNLAGIILPSEFYCMHYYWLLFHSDLSCIYRSWQTFLFYSSFSHFWIGNWSHIATYLVVILLLVTMLCKKPESPSFQIGPRWNLAGLFFQVNTYRLT